MATKTAISNEVELKKAPVFVLYKGKKSKPDVIARAIRSLTMVLRVGESEARALEIVGEQFHKFEIGRAFEHAAEVMRQEGATFKQALMAEEVIPRTARELIEASPTSQALHKNLHQAAKLVAESESVKKKLLMNLIQPGFMLGLCVALLFGSVAFIIPGFISVFDEMGSETPALTIAILDVADVVKWVLGGLIAAFLLFLGYWALIGRKSQAFRAGMDNVFIRIPHVGPILQLAATSRLFQLLSANLSTGISEPDALIGAARGCGNEAMKKHCLEHADRMIEEGAPLKEFAKSKLFPSAAGQMLASSPSVRQEIEVMSELSPEYSDEANTQLEALSRVLDPLINYIVYGIAGALIVCLMLPMYSIYPSLMEM